MLQCAKAMIKQRPSSMLHDQHVGDRCQIAVLPLKDGGGKSQMSESIMPSLNCGRSLWSSSSIDKAVDERAPHTRVW